MLQLELRAVLFCAAFLFAQAALADTATGGSPGANSGLQLDAIMADYWEFHLAADPIAATQAGLSSGNDRMPSVTPEELGRELNALAKFRARLRDLDQSTLDERVQVNAKLFAWVLDDSIRAHELNVARIPFNTFSGFYMNALTASNGVRMREVEDYEAYLARLADIPRYFAENLANMEQGAESGFVLPQIVIDGVLPTIRAQVKDDPEDSSFYEPFRTMSTALSDDEQRRLSALGRAVIADQVMPAFSRVAQYLDTEYPASETIGAEQRPDGKAYYAFAIKRYTTIPDLAADEIHEIGLAEVARIKTEMQAIIDELGFTGDFDAFAEYLRTGPQFYATSAEQLLQQVARIAKRIDYRMPGFFGLLPRQPYGIVPVPDEIAPNYTTGAYHSSPPGGDHGGEFWVNTFALDQRPLYELPALTLHEAVPGHHHQNAIAAEMQDVPAFRNDLYFSAFGEGWGLYAEKLGVEMGIYQTPFEHFGRLSYEMWRACRLVIDTGIHAKGWSRQQAIDFMSDNTSLSEGNIRAEIDRYISWPGQALAYKLGELRIWELRRRAEELLGKNFDLREFHDAILANGALPLEMLNEVVDRYIDSALESTE
ncbi:MAG TPA: DUF885 family protein [Woeseiaceae bacterium]|nr:DUF885 family protein [Woeseiaceae bacterium]